MHLTNRQERILEGDAGQAEQLCYRILVNLGELEGAERMIPIKGAHISGVSYKTGGEGLIRVLERFQGLGARTSVQATLNPAGMDQTDWVTMGVPEDFAEKQKTIIAGVLALYCNSTILYWHGSSLREYFDHYPNNLLHAEIVRDGCMQGYRLYDLNPSGGHPGVVKFKESLSARRVDFKSYHWKKRLGTKKG